MDKTGENPHIFEFIGHSENTKNINILNNCDPVTQPPFTPEFVLASHRAFLAKKAARDGLSLFIDVTLCNIGYLITSFIELS